MLIFDGFSLSLRGRLRFPLFYRYFLREALQNAGYALAFTVLAAFILLGIMFDIIGVAVTAGGRKAVSFHGRA